METFGSSHGVTILAAVITNHLNLDHASCQKYWPIGHRIRLEHLACTIVFWSPWVKHTFFEDILKIWYTVLEKHSFKLWYTYNRIVIYPTVISRDMIYEYHIMNVLCWTLQSKNSSKNTRADIVIGQLHPNCRLLHKYSKLYTKTTTLPETNSLHLRINGWKMNVLLRRPYFLVKIF